jgi:hypothetical protein
MENLEFRCGSVACNMDERLVTHTVDRGDGRDAYITSTRPSVDGAWALEHRFRVRFWWWT